jgi:hypothetical protein
MIKCEAGFGNQIGLQQLIKVSKPFFKKTRLNNELEKSELLI